MAEAKKVVFATEEATIHLLLSDKPMENGSYATESQVLLPGQFVAQEKVPPYLLEAVKAGTAPALQLMTERRAKQVSTKAAEIRALANNTVSVQGPVSEGDAMSESIKTASAQTSEENSE